MANRLKYAIVNIRKEFCEEERTHHLGNNNNNNNGRSWRASGGCLVNENVVNVGRWSKEGTESKINRCTGEPR